MSERDNVNTGQVTDSAAEVYERFFVPALFDQWPDHVLDEAGLCRRDDVLDVGCGTGILARAAARHLDGSGTVTGVDVNDGMLAVARSMSDDVAWRCCRAEHLPFADQSFDRVVSQFALMFFADRAAAVSEMARVARPGGTAVIATWAAIDQSPGYAAMVDLLRRLFGSDAASALLAPFVLGTRESLEAVIGDVMSDTVVTRHEGVARFDSIEAWVHTDIRGWTLADMIDDAQYDELLAAARTELAGFADSDGRVRFAAPALIATCRP